MDLGKEMGFPIPSRWVLCLKVHSGFSSGLGGARSGSQLVLEAPPQAEGQAQARG